MPLPTFIHGTLLSIWLQASLRMMARKGKGGGINDRIYPLYIRQQHWVWPDPYRGSLAMWSVGFLVHFLSLSWFELFGPLVMSHSLLMPEHFCYFRKESLSSTTKSSSSKSEQFFYAFSRVSLPVGKGKENWKKIHGKLLGFQWPLISKQCGIECVLSEAGWWQILEGSLQPLQPTNHKAYPLPSFPFPLTTFTDHKMRYPALGETLKPNCAPRLLCPFLQPSTSWEKLRTITPACLGLYNNTGATVSNVVLNWHG